MYRKEFSRPKRKSMLGKRRQNIAIESTKPVSSTKNKEMQIRNNLFSVARSLPKSKLGRRLQEEIENVQPQVKFKKCLFNNSGEGIGSNYETSSDISGIGNLSPYLVSQHKRHSAYKGSQEKPGDFSTVKKDLEHHKSSLKELNCAKRSVITPHCFGFALKTPTPPPPLYDMYLRGNVFVTNNTETESSLNPASKDCLRNCENNTEMGSNLNPASKDCLRNCENNIETESNLNPASKDCLRNCESLSSFSNKHSMEMENHTGCNTEVSKSSFCNIPLSTDTHKGGCQRNIFESSITEESDDSFLFNEQSTLIGNTSITDSLIYNKTEALGVINEETSPSKTILYNRQSANGSWNEVLTQPNYKSQFSKIIENVKIDSPSNSSDININNIQTVVEAMFNENTELLASYQKNVFNDCSRKIEGTLTKIVKTLALSTLPKYLENILNDNAHMLNNIFINQNDECGKLLNQLKDMVNLDADKNKEINKTINHMKLEAENILRENEKLVEKLQNDVTQRFQKDLSVIVNNNKHIDAILNIMNTDLEAAVVVNFELAAQQNEVKKQHCLSHLKSMKEILNNDVLEGGNIRSLEFEEKIHCLITDLNSISNLNSAFVNSFKSKMLFHYQNKIPLLIDNIMKQEVNDILNAFKSNLQENINQFKSQLKSQSEKCMYFKVNITKNIEQFQNASEKSKVYNCTVSPNTHKKKFKSSQKLQSTKKMYSELKTQFKYCLQTPVASTRKSTRFSHNSFNVLTPCSMSTIINDQVNDLLDS